MVFRAPKYIQRNGRVIPVILSGGVGSRLWPLSRGKYPKQFLCLVDPKLSMLQQTVGRSIGIDGIGPSVIVCNQEHRFMVGEQLQQVGIKDAQILLESEGRNTAPAIALAALSVAEKNPNELMLVMPADHVIRDLDAFHKAINVASALAKEGSLVTFGIVPQGPETGYGYIKAGVGKDGGFDVAEFKEKPDKKTAQQYIESGDYYWNGGIFVFTASAFLEELKRFEPEVYDAAEKAMSKAIPDLDFIRIDEVAFASSPSISIDYAVMERTAKAKMVALDAGWNDVGSWSALWDVSDKDENGNAITGDVIVVDTRNSHIYSENKLVSVVGVDNLVVVETDDEVLVTDRDHSQNVKAIVNQLESLKRTQISHHRKVYRPWGWYDSIDSGDRFQVKRIQVKPGAKLSVQMHHYRAEHWVVVRGMAEILNGEQTIVLKENQSTYIPIGAKHSLRNPSETEVLEIIEVQSGSYLGEDDIVRFEDNYGRAGTNK
ncbi:MAG: mannose-1-phosphate guanylyltransferase/mannose-6-phosphate isomerase [Arenicella sp.]|nr:mannose-1-phosphate guanylyltransferase/mannose-6-phosphate isomerase [Arenicella sp.]